MRELAGLIACALLTGCTAGTHAEPGPASPQAPPSVSAATTASPGPGPSPTRTEPSTEWRRLADTPLTHRRLAVMVVLRGRIMVVGGTVPCDGTCGAAASRRDSAAYDPRHDRWHRRPDSPPNLAMTPAVAVEGDRLYLPANEDVLRGRVLEYDASDRIWAAYPRARGRHRIGVLAVRDGYVQTAEENGGAQPLRQLRLRTVVWRQLPRPPYPRMDGRQLAWTPWGLVLSGEHHGLRLSLLRGARWERLPGPGRPTGHRVYAVAGRMVAPFPDRGPSMALDLRSRRWRVLDRHPDRTTAGFATGTSADGALVLSDGLLYDDRTGRTRRVPAPPGVSEGSAVVHHRRIYLLDDRSRLWVLPVRSLA